MRGCSLSPSAAPMRQRARLEFVEAEDGTVHVEVLTRDPAGDLHAWGGVWTLSDELTAGAVLIDTSGVPDHPRTGWGDLPPGWRYLSLRAKIEPGPTGRYVRRWLDLSEGSDDRRIVAKLVDQGAARFVWVKEGLEVVRELPDTTRQAWKEALGNTRGVDRDAWQEEMAELEWMHSPAWRPGRPRPRKHRRRTAMAPEHPLPFFARRSGAIPRAGRPTVAGVKLPRGSRCTPATYWATEEDVAEAALLSSRLAAAFPDTGLWPMLWAWNEDPDSYLGGSEDLEVIDASDAREVLRDAWESTPPNPEATAPFGCAFPGLATASVTHESALASQDPFRVLADRPRDPWPYPGRRLLLVPCNRPADATTVLGYESTGIDAPRIGAVLRSWEERFAAVPVELGPSTLTLVVGAPPTTFEQALGIAAEHHAVAPTEDSGRPGAIHDLAGTLLDGRAGTDGWRPTLALSPNLWELAFRE